MTPAATAPLHVVDDVPEAFTRLVARGVDLPATTAPPATVALSGGSTAHRCYERLARARADWSGTTVLFGDERWVPVDSPDSNEGAARRLLLDAVRPAAVHSLRGAGATIDEAAAAYDALLREAGPVELVHLGLGADGHTASLFPGTAALDERERLVVPNGDERHDHPRLTFTYSAIAAARVVVFTVEGEEKAEALRAVRAGEDRPATRVHAADVRWIVDRPAASRLGAPAR